MVVGRRDAAQYFRLVAVVLPLNVFGVVAVSWLRMQRRPWATMFYALGTSLLNIFLSILFVVVLREGLRGVFMAQVGAALVGSLIALALMRDWVSPRRFRWKRLSEMLRFGMPLIPAALAYWIVSFSDRFFVQYYTNTAEVGLYQIGSSIAGLVALLTGAFQLAWGPFAISIHKQEDARRVYAYVLLLYVSVTSFISTAAALFAPEAIRLVATRQYEGASTVVGLLAFSYVMIGLVYIAATGPTIVKTTRPTGIALIAAAGLNILLNILLVPRLGKEGSAIATLISQGLVPLYLFWRAQQLYEIPYRFGPAIGMLALGLSLVWIGEHWQFDSRWLGTVVKLALICLFIPALFLFRIITPSQLRHVQFRS
jgi:O-antigen/teichoic acid export membrane protein